MKDQVSQEKQDKSPIPTKKKQVNSYIRYSGMAMQMGLTIALFAYAGKWLDGYFETAQPYFTIVLALIGVIGAMYTTLKDLIND